MIEDISTEKRVKATMARYMDPAIAARMLDNNSDAGLLGGASTRATVLFSDIRDFTTLSEELGAQGTVAFLNDYFSLMVECIAHEAVSYTHLDVYKRQPIDERPTLFAYSRHASLYVRSAAPLPTATT